MVQVSDVTGGEYAARMGTDGYRRANTVLFDPEWVIVEVGFQRDNDPAQEGSTEVLAQVGPPVHVIDVEPEQVQRAWELNQRLGARDERAGRAGRGRLVAHLGLAEDVLQDWGTLVGAPIGFAWLDGHDWPYAHAPAGTWDAQEREYLRRGQEYSREASRDSHLEVARLIQPHVPVGGVVAFDDTWELPSVLDKTPAPAPPDRAWNGKGGAAVSYLLNHGFQVTETGDIYHGLTVLRREKLT